jgi:hypothetical protein
MAGGTGTGAGNTVSGWTFQTGDAQVTNLSFDPTIFKPSPSTSLKIVPNPASLGSFPTVYFDGTPRETSNGTAGAVKAD